MSGGGTEIYGVLYAALYDENDRVIAIQKYDAVKSQTVNFEETTYSTLKVFWWDESLKPIVMVQ